MQSTTRISELQLRHLWEEASFDGIALRTTEGKHVEVLSPGFPNRDGGPDFAQAEVRIGETLYRGDVEVHLDAGSWYGHGHQRDPHYNGVILHVALHCRPGELSARTRSGRSVPLLLLGNYSLLFEKALSHAVSLGGAESALPCHGCNCQIPPMVLHRWLRRLSRERLEEKVRRFGARLADLAAERRRARGAGPMEAGSRRELKSRALWDQLWYEALMECLGYAKNRKPMRALARAMPWKVLRRCSRGKPEDFEPLLFGAAGLLPSSRGLPLKDARVHVRRLRRRWKELRNVYRGPVLHEAEWLFFRLRPANFPTARLAAMAGLLPRVIAGGGFSKVLALGVRVESTPRERLRALLSELLYRPEGFWRTHTHFRATTAGEGVSLGRSRALDIVMNAVVPLLILHARLHEDGTVCRHALGLYSALPSLQENSITAHIRRNLEQGRLPLRSASDQQGMLQLHRAYCQRGRCRDCLLGHSGCLPGKPRLEAEEKQLERFGKRTAECPR